MLGQLSGIGEHDALCAPRFVGLRFTIAGDLNAAIALQIHDQAFLPARHGDIDFGENLGIE